MQQSAEEVVERLHEAVVESGGCSKLPWRDRRPIPARETDAAAVALAAARRLCERAGADLADGVAPRLNLHGSWSGPCRPRVEVRSSKGIGVALQTEEGYAADRAWHSFWRQHDYATTDERLAAQAPPAPQDTRAPMVWFSWARLGRLHREALDQAEQLALEIAA